ncbi:unnamed protein product [Symbiodinium sp. CCMP2592]|nr:unnamed protein product [Symbiodinium sp. CCMP2592]
MLRLSRRLLPALRSAGLKASSKRCDRVALLRPVRYHASRTPQQTAVEYLRELDQLLEDELIEEEFHKLQLQRLLNGAGVADREALAALAASPPEPESLQTAEDLKDSPEASGEASAEASAEARRRAADQLRELDELLEDELIEDEALTAVVQPDVRILFSDFDSLKGIFGRGSASIINSILVKDMADDDMTSAFSYDLEKLQVMKAKTMYEMVEDIDAGSGPVKLLFLTNMQADSIKSSSKTLRKLLEAFEIPQPKLVINLLTSSGLRNFLNLFPANCAMFGNESSSQLKNDAPPFLSAEEEHHVLTQLDTFMSDVLLPLAASTQALILTCAVSGECALAGALSRAFRQQQARWGPSPPFTILYTTVMTPLLYLNSDPDAYWRALRRKSKSWSSRDRTLLEMVHAEGFQGFYPGSTDLNHDLDRDGCCFLIVDQMGSTRKHFDAKPGNELRNELVRFLSSTLPSIALRTGYVAKFNSTTDKTWQVCLNQVHAGTELLLLDLRPRPMEVPGGGQWVSRAQFIEAAWAKLVEGCDALLAEGKCDSLDVCNVAYAHHALYHFPEKDDARAGFMQQRRVIPLHEAIKEARAERQHQVSSVDLDEDRWEATDAQVMDIARRLAGRVLQDCRKALGRPLSDEFEQIYDKKAVELASQIRSVLVSPQAHQVNIHDMAEAKRIVNNLIQSDRLPRTNSLEGLLLMQQAWCECDVAHHLANRYKIQTKVLYVCQLLLAWLVILFSQVQLGATSSFASSDIVFVLAVLHGAVVSVEGYLRPKPKWQALRGGATALESMMWLYRTRVGQFRMGPAQDPRNPEIVFCRQLNEWTEDLFAAGDLQRSAWSKSFSSSIHRHQQCEGDPDRNEAAVEDAAIDDHYSPVQPDLYISFRLMRRMEWYQKRLPTYIFHAWVFKLLVLSCTVACAVLARFGQPTAVVIITAFSSSSTTWSEFVDAGSKVERYSRAVRTMSRLLNWWKHLTEVERASMENIARLIIETEQAIAKEQANWMPSHSAGTVETGGKPPPEAQNAPREVPEARPRI